LMGNCWDNAVAKSFFSSLKKERIKKHVYQNRELALTDVSEYIDAFYNRTRRHRHLGGMSPEQFEAAQRSRHRLSTRLWQLHPTWFQLVRRCRSRSRGAWLSRCCRSEGRDRDNEPEQTHSE
jgi:hypothetical protein